MAVRDEGRLTVYRWNGATWEDMGGMVDKRNRRVVAMADGLGTFVLGYGEGKGGVPGTRKPMVFGMSQNYPNPARNETVIAYTLASGTTVKLEVYDLSGRKVATVESGAKTEGVHEVKYDLRGEDGKALPAGVYVYRLTAGSDVATRKMVVTR